MSTQMRKGGVLHAALLLSGVSKHIRCDARKCHGLSDELCRLSKVWIVGSQCTSILEPTRDVICIKCLRLLKSQDANINGGHEMSDCDDFRRTALSPVQVIVEFMLRLPWAARGRHEEVIGAAQGAGWRCGHEEAELAFVSGVHWCKGFVLLRRDPGRQRDCMSG
jgi:hypothetical protein